MTDLSDYQRKGDLWSPFSPTKNVERAHEQAQKLHDYVQEVVAKAPPIPPAREQIAALLRRYANASKPAQMRWRLRAIAATWWRRSRTRSTWIRTRCSSPGAVSRLRR